VNTFCPNHPTPDQPATKWLGGRLYCDACHAFLSAPAPEVQRQIEDLVKELEAIKAARP
jgi:hypothetical protein